MGLKPIFLLIIKMLCAFFFSELYGQNSIIYGKIVDSYTGEYLNNVTLTLRDGKNNLIEKKSIDGEYNFSIKELGSYKLDVEKNEEYNPVLENITVQHGDSIRRDIVMKRPPKFLCIIKVNGQDCNDTLKEIDTSVSGNLFRFALFNSGSVPLKWVVSKNCEWISVLSSENNATSGTLNSEEKENMTVTIDPEKIEAGKTTGKILVMSNNGNAVLSIKAIGKYPDITVLPPVTTAYHDSNHYFPDTFKAQINFNGRHTYKEMGFCFSDNNEIPTIEDKYVLANDLGEFSYRNIWNTSYTLPWLGTFNEQEVCRTYYVRAFLKYENENDTVIYSSNVEKFTLWEILCP